MNKEKLLNKIGSLIDKGGFTEEELTALFHDDGEAVAPKAPEQPEGEDKEVKPEDVESEPKEAEKPEEEKPEGVENEEHKPSSEAVPEEAPKAEEKPVEAQPEWEERFNELASKIDGLTRENESLREALKKAKVLEDVNPDKQVGVGTSASPNLEREGSDLSATLEKLNRGRK